MDRQFVEIGFSGPSLDIRKRVGPPLPVGGIPGSRLAARDTRLNRPRTLRCALSPAVQEPHVAGACNARRLSSPGNVSGMYWLDH
jgi:hypothetical protein